MDGGLFREARERAGLSLDELAQALDVREEYLYALERGELGLLVGPSYMQSIAVRYAAGVNLDSEMVLAACDEVPPPASSTDDQRDTRREHRGRRSPRRLLFLRRSLLAMLVLVGVVVAVLAVLRSVSVISLTEAISASSGQTAATSVALITTSTSTTLPSTTTTSTSTTLPSTTTTSAGVFTVVFNPSADVWIEITDLKTGKALFHGLRTAGERLKLQFTAPANVVVGKPEVLKVSFNGIVVKTPTALVWRLSSSGIASAQ